MSIENSGSDFMPQYKPYLFDGKAVMTSPHKVFGPEQNDFVLQLQKRGIRKVILAGMSTNLCPQAHLYELLEQGFEVAVARDATAAAKIPEGGNPARAFVCRPATGSRTVQPQRRGVEMKTQLSYQFFSALAGMSRLRGCRIFATTSMLRAKTESFRNKRSAAEGALQN